MISIIYLENIKKKSIIRISFLLIVVFIILFSLYSTYNANKDLTQGYSLFMDERITFNGVKKILHPTTLSNKEFISSNEFWELVESKLQKKYPSLFEKIIIENSFIIFLKKIDFYTDFLEHKDRSRLGGSLWWAISDGGDQRYGRSLWNSMALFSYFPEKIWGEEGQIIAGRMLQSVLIISSGLIFVFGILKGWLARFTLLIAVLAMPYADYYMTMPKPEPLQIFFLSIFCYYFYKKEMQLNWQWIFLGLAFGTKISALPATIVFISFAYIFSEKLSRIEIFNEKKLSIISFLMGLVISVPILLIPYILALGGYLVWLKIKPIKKFYKVLKFLGGLFFSIIILFVFLKPLIVWVGSTFLNTTHGSDQTEISYLSWIKYFYFEWFKNVNITGIFLSILILSFIIINLIIINDLSIKDQKKRISAVAIFSSGMAKIFLIFTTVHRIWGFYLYPGMLLITTGTLILVDQALNSPINVSSYKKRYTLNKILAISISFLIFYISFFSWIPLSLRNLNELNGRTSTRVHVEQLVAYKEILIFLETNESKNNKFYEILYDPSLYLPKNTHNYRISEFWGELNWMSGATIIIIGPATLHKLDGGKFSKIYDQHVGDGERLCATAPCYQRVRTLSNGGVILRLINP